LIDQATGAENRMYPSTVNDETTGEETTYYSISSLNGKKSTEVYYRLEYAVQKDYEGIYPVKLVVSQENNEYRYSYWSGYYYHAKTTGSDEAVTIKVLQILPEHLWETRSHSLFDMDLTGSYETGSETKNTNYAPLFANKYINHNASTFYRKYYYDRNTGKATSDLCDVTSEYADSWTDNVTITDSNYENINKGRWNAVINSFKSSNFYKLAFDKSSTENKLSGYDLEIDSVYSDSLANYFTEGTGTSADPYTFDMEDYQNFLNYYDMLIIGFGDYVQYFSNYNTYTIASSKIKNELLHPKEDHDNECRRNETIKDTVNLQTNLVDYYYAGIHNYIASGKSVLFTHDTTVSNTNDEIVQNGDVDWSSGLFSDLLAGDVGFDRYGIYDNDDSLLSLVLSAGISDVTKESTVSLSVSSYPSLKLAMAKISELYEESGNDTTKSYGLNGTEATITSGQLYNIIVGEAEKENKDVAYKPNSNKTVLTAEVQGKSSIAINQQGSSQYISFLTQNENGKVTTFDNRKISTTWSDTVTTAEVINQGQILVYPYNVCSDLTYTDENGENGILTISATHMQYFQIDMNADEDQDGESDVTVWLTLRDKATADIMYDVAKRDARNNYYIYTKGNVTYSGVGHDSINSWGDNTSTSEIKLYINTMIVAYQASAQDPEITIKESADTTSADKDTIYVSVDASIDDEGVVSTTTTTDGVEKLNTIEDISMSTTISSEKWNAKVTEDSGASTYERMYVYVQDTNVLRNAEKNIKLSYYLILDDEYSGLDKDAVTAKLSGTVLANFSSLVTDISGLSSSSGGTHVWAIPLSLSTYSISYDANGKQKTKAFDADEDSAVSGRMYCVDVPYYLIGDSTRAEVRCYVTTTVTKNGTQVSKKSGYDTVYLQQLSLFDLQ
jgi:frataxin-like iron-binding protein CyaY